MSCDKCGFTSMFSQLDPELFGYSLCLDCHKEIKYIVSKYINGELKK